MNNYGDYNKYRKGKYLKTDKKKDVIVLWISGSMKVVFVCMYVCNDVWMCVCVWVCVCVYVVAMVSKLKEQW
jgi:hypothetical protein